MPASPPVLSADDLLWIAAKRVQIAPFDIEAFLHLTSPRVRFLKTLPAGAALLDVGAGDGGLEVFRNWLEPARPDLRMFAASLDKGDRFDAYDGYEIGDFNAEKPKFGDMTFDAIFASHFVEHIDGGLPTFLDWARTRLRPGGRIFVEFPSLHSKTAPRRVDVIAGGLNVSCLNFFDDSTHVDTIGIEECRDLAEERGFFVDESGYWRNPFIEDALLQRGREQNNQYLATAGAWMKTRFCQYLVATLL